MKRVPGLLLAMVLVAVVVLAQQAPLSTNPIVDIQGKVTSVRLERGQGMPAINVDTGAKTVTVWLGSMRYLMEKKFSPKTGDAVEVRGYSTRNANQEEEIVAISVKLPATNQVLQLRDEKTGLPVWSSGGAGYCRHHGANCPHH